MFGHRVQKLHVEGKDAAPPRVRIPALFTVVAEDPAATMDELAPYTTTTTTAMAPG